MSMFSKSHLLLVIIIFLIFPFVCSGQGAVIRENFRGEKLKVYPDGRIEYFNGDPYEPTEEDGLITYPVFQGYIEPLDGEVSVNEVDLYKIAQRRSQLSSTAAELAQQRLTQAQENLQRLQDSYNATSGDEARRGILQKQIAAARRTLEQSQVQLNESQRAAQQDDQLVKKGGFIESFNQRVRENRLREANSQRIRSVSNQSYAQLIPLTNNTAASSFEDLMLRPPRRECRYAFDGQDAETGRYRRDLQPELLFSYTDERLRPYLQDKEYLVCEAYISSAGGFRYLTLNFTFAYPNAQEAYGFIDQNSVLTIKLLNGDVLNLRSGKMDRGQYNTVKKELTYSVYYPIDRSYIGLLKTSEVDLLRVFWSSGFEEYPIHQMDFFQRQFQCLGD
ncbi:MAG: hypothetical protein ACRBG0_10330 [Lewinella sp.]|uniref:hypothetical protein n=1 Tax=Lewinella sp. TaxID=2004506 RepID=UPI003D6A672C